VSVDDRLAPSLLPDRARNGTVCRMADRPDHLDANYRQHGRWCRCWIQIGGIVVTGHPPRCCTWLLHDQVDA
jgi:hypothetical protein